MTIMSEDPIGSPPASPASAKWLGYTGLIPFVVASICTFLFRGNPELQDLSGTALLAYGAVILSFLGGIRWGTALSEPDKTDQMRQLILSVLPSLLGWLCLLIPEYTPALILLAFGFAGQLYFDLRSAATEQLPAWFGKLRVQLTVGAVVCVLFAALHLM